MLLSEPWGGAGQDAVSKLHAPGSTERALQARHMCAPFAAHIHEGNC
jgi:hypothetical protein